MRVCSVIEITRSGGQLPASLMAAAYRSSRNGLVVFILNDVTAQAVNVILDPVVATMPLSIPGVLYIKIEDVARVREAVVSADAIYAATTTFKNLATTFGVKHRSIHPVASATRALNSWSLSANEYQSCKLAWEAIGHQPAARTRGGSRKLLRVIPYNDRAPSATGARMS